MNGHQEIQFALFRRENERRRSGSVGQAKFLPGMTCFCCWKGKRCFLPLLNHIMRKTLFLKTRAAVYSWTGFRRTGGRNDEGKNETFRVLVAVARIFSLAEQVL